MTWHSAAKDASANGASLDVAKEAPPLARCASDTACKCDDHDAL